MNIAGFDYCCKQCGVCGVVHYIPQCVEDECVKQGAKKSWFCPNGHELVYRESSEDIIRRERDRLQQRLAQKDDEIAVAKKHLQDAKHLTAVYKGQVTKIKKRVSGGVCPCCNRSFEHLKKHMQTKHPDFAEVTH